MDRDADRLASARGGPAGELQTVAADLEHGHVIASRIDRQQPALVLTQDKRALIPEAAARAFPACRGRPRRLHATVDRSGEDQYAVGVGGIGEGVHPTNWNESE